MKNTKLNKEIIMVKITSIFLWSEMVGKEVIDIIDYPQGMANFDIINKGIMQMESTPYEDTFEEVIKFYDNEDKKLLKNKNNKLEFYKLKFEKALENLSEKMDEINECVIYGYPDCLINLDEFIHQVYELDFSEFNSLYREGK